MEVNPAIIFTHPLVDYVSDYENTGKLVLEAGPGEGFNQQLMAGYPIRNILAETVGLDKVYPLR